MIVAIIGIPWAVQKSVLGWILSILGVGGILALVIASFLGRQGEKPRYDDFPIGVFLFFVILGVFVGIPIGMETHSFWLGLPASLAGLVVGYFIGILGGLWLQCLGWIAIVINMPAVVGTIILSGTIVILLVILAFP
ncbi:MAG: hypothetical protein EG826_14035 [Deltaproteobacteria bacterium]|nr:hypothetical protein [Deltaproteobacteria bacterium]